MTAELLTDIRNGHGHCILCGDLNPRSWRLSFKEMEDDGVRAEFVAGTEFEGYE